ncbi:MAG: arginase [Clostridium sp.]
MKINILGVPIFYGCDRKGVDNGPRVLRENGLLEILKENNEVNDLGDIEVSNVTEEFKFNSHATLKYLDQVVDCNTLLAKEVYSSLCNNSFPLIIGGDHSIGLGTIAGSSKYFGQDMGVIWVDAHGDINTTESSPSGNIHGMPLAASFGLGNEKLSNIFFNGKKINMENIFILAARDLDEGELKLIEKENLNVWTFNDIKEKGLDKCLNELLNKVAQRNIKNLHLSFDIDCLDPMFVPGTGTPVDDGLTLEGGLHVLKTILSTNLVRSMDFVEFNPMLDKSDTTLNSCLTMLKTISKSLCETER